MNEQDLQNGNSSNNTGNNLDGHRITFLELILNIVAFAFAATFEYKGYDHFRWWFFIIGIIISVFLSLAFDAEKYNKGAYIGSFIGFFIVFALIFQGIGLPVWTWLIIWPILYSVMVKIISRIKAKQTTCDRCKKEYAMEVYDTKFLGSERISITKSQWITDVYGKQHENRYEVPGKREYYRDHRRCKYCGYEDTIDYTEEHEN